MNKYYAFYITNRECEIIEGDAAWCVVERTRVADVVVAQYGEDERAARIHAWRENTARGIPATKPATKEES